MNPPSALSDASPSGTRHTLDYHSAIVILLLLSGYRSSEWNQSARICNYASHCFDMRDRRAKNKRRCVTHENRDFKKVL